MFRPILLIRLMLLIIGFILPLSSFAGEVDEKARSSAQQFLQISSNFDTFFTKVQNAWEKNCDPERPQTCVIRECDVSPKACRRNHILLFRGEAKKYPYPAVSHFMRTRWTGSSYASGTLQEWLEQFRVDMELMRPMTMGPDQGDSPVLIREGSKSAWFYRNTTIPFKPLNEPIGESLSLLNMLFILHTQAAYPYFSDNQIGERSLDPLVSFSVAPTEALRFSEKKGGVFLVVSVPRNEMHHECGEELPKPGQFFDPLFCSEKSQFPEEMEYNAFLFVEPQYIFKSFIRE